MKPKTMILMGLAIACGLGASWMTSKLIAGRGADEQETVNILVAGKAVNVGDLLKKPEEFFLFKAVAAKDVPEGAIKDLAQVKDKIMKKSLRKGDHISLNETYGTHEQLEIPEGHEAVGLKVDRVSSASGFASLPRSRVNVMLTVRVNNNDINLSYVQVLLQDVLVLAAGTKLDRDTGIASEATEVTLALLPEDVRRVTGAKEMGNLSLSLRKPGNHSRIEKTVMTFAEIKASKEKKDGQAPYIPEDIAKLPTPAPVAPPVVKTEDVKPVVPPVVTPEPKTSSKTLVIGNGGQQTTTRYNYDEDGNLLEGGADAGPVQPVIPRQKRTGGTSDH